MKKTSIGFLRRFAAGITAAAAMAACTIAASAEDSVNEKVKAAQEGVYAVELRYENTSDESFPIQSGSAFFINPTTMLTCDHVVTLDSKTEAAVKELAKTSYGSYSKGNVTVKVKLQSDISVGANVLFSSPEGDWAVLQINESIKNAPLSFGKSDEAQNTQSVFAIGFPSSVANYKSIKNFSRDDITTTKGVISKVLSEKDVKKIQHGATISEGNSGGPLVDENGAVIGINNEGVVNKDYYYAIATEQIISVLEQKQIDYTRYGETASEEASQSSDEAASSPAETSSQDAAAAVTDDTSSSDESDGMDTKTIVLIAGGAALALCLIAAAVLLTRKKPEPAPSAPKHKPSAQPTIAQVFTLVRAKTGEKAAIDKITFVVGKDKGCDYCIEGNSSISRTHARFIVKGTDCFISDMRSTNGTFVNNKRISPNEEVKLRSGDIIRISDEEFEFRA